ncbi:MAG: hypothetical protein WDA02_06730 [Saccharofermentanales bacterium]
MEENKKFEESLNKVKEIENFDYKSNDFDHNEFYSVIENIAKQNNTIKNNEAENIIKNDSSRLIDKKFIDELEVKKNRVLDLIRKYDPNSDMVKNMHEYDIDKVYAISTYLINVYIQYLHDMTFNFEIKTEEYKFLNKILTRVIEYNGDDVFNYVDFYETVWSNVIQQYESDRGVSSIKINIPIKKILILHHLIKDYKVKGITEEFRYFRNILYKIAETNKLFNAYNIIVERIKDDCKLWSNALDEVLSNKDNVKDITEVNDEIKKED